jgi:hypothetical protein
VKRRKNMQKKTRKLYKQILLDSNYGSMPVLEEILDTLDGEGWQIRSGEFCDDEFYRVIATKQYKFKRFKATTECHMWEEIVYVRTECLSPIPNDKYHFALEQVNWNNFDNLRVSYGISPDRHTVNCFDSVSYNTNFEQGMPEGAYLFCIWGGIRNCNNIVRSIEKM